MRGWNKGWAGMCAVASLALITAYVRALTQGRVITSLHMDGVFQTSSMLYRLAGGQFPGRDFLPYLGIGPMLALFPGFLLMGRTVVASTTTASLLSILMEAFEATLIVALALGERRRRRLWLVFTGVLSLVPLLQTEFPMFGPGNSLRPIRAFLPYACVAAVMLMMERVQRSGLRYALLGALSGASLLWSNDYGIPTFVVLIVLVSIEGWTRKEFSLGRGFLFFACAGLAAATLLTLITAGHPMELLRYNIKDVAGDQYWFFAGSARASKIIELKDLKILGWEIFTIVAASVGALTVRRRRFAYLLAVGWATFLGGALATVGGHYENGYLFAFNCWATVTAVLVLGCRLPGLPQGMRRGWVTGLAAGVFGVFVLGSLIFNVRRYSLAIGFMKSNEIYVEELRGYVYDDQKDVVAFARSSRDPLLEENWGLASAMRRTNGPWKVDLAIAALGSQRAIADRQMRDWNGVIVTTKLGGMISEQWLHEYQAWAVNDNWWLYQYVLENYDPALATPNLMYWKKAAVPRVWAEAPCSVTNSPKPHVSIEGEDGYYDLTLEYAFHSGRWHATLLEQTNTTIFGNDTYGLIAIDPRATESRKPVYIAKDLPEGLDFVVYPEKLVGALQLKGCKARKIVQYPPDILSHVTRAGLEAHKVR